MTELIASYQAAAELIREADALVIGAGAGMGVDSGLPDFRGNEGFWRAYPALANAGLDFMQVASPATFERDPTLAWGFYAHRLNLYRKTTPHEDFSILRGWAARLFMGARVFTSNVDGHFCTHLVVRLPAALCTGCLLSPERSLFDALRPALPVHQNLIDHTPTIHCACPQAWQGAI